MKLVGSVNTANRYSLWTSVSKSPLQMGWIALNYEIRGRQKLTSFSKKDCTSCCWGWFSTKKRGIISQKTDHWPFLCLKNLKRQCFSLLHWIACTFKVNILFFFIINSKNPHNSNKSNIESNSSRTYTHWTSCPGVGSSYIVSSRRSNIRLWESKISS